MIQKKKYLTFEELCPVHSNLLSNWDKLTDKQQCEEATIIHSNAHKCIVGEAFGFDSKETYGVNHQCCVEYGGYTYGFPRAFNRKYTPDGDLIRVDIDWKLFEERKEAFVKHFNKVHR